MKKSRLVLRSFLVGVAAALGLASSLAQSVEETVQRFGQEPLALPKAGFALRWVVTETFGHSRCVTVFKTDDQASVTLVELASTTDRSGVRHDRIVFSGQVKLNLAISEWFLRGPKNEPSFWKRYSDLEAALAESSTDGACWWFEYATPEERKTITILQPDVLAHEGRQNSNIRDMSPYMDAMRAANELLVQAGMAGWKPLEPPLKSSR